MTTLLYINTYRWDFAQVAALMAPRPLLIANSDKDSIFPLDGVVRLHGQVRSIYKLYNAADKLGLLITEGPHKDTQELQVPTFRWFNRFLKKDEMPLKDVSAEKPLKPEELKVFPPGKLPADQINTRIHEVFVPMAAAPVVPASAGAWAEQRDGWLKELRSKTFGGWPENVPPLDLKTRFVGTAAGIQLSGYEFTSQEGVRLRMYMARAAGNQPLHEVRLRVIDSAGWARFLATMRVSFAGQLSEELSANPTPASEEEALGYLKGADTAMIWLAPRGVGPTAWAGSEKKQTQILRRFALLGQTLDGMRVWDVRRAVQAARVMPDTAQSRLGLTAEGPMTVVALYAAVFEPGVSSLELVNPPASHADGPALLNVLRTLDMPAAVAVAGERCNVRLSATDPSRWAYPQAVAKRLGWAEGRMVVER